MNAASEVLSRTADGRISSNSGRDGESWQRLRESGDPALREALIRRHLPYARVVAASYYARRTHDDVEFAEYLQFASLGLVESVDRYEPARGAQFTTFAARRMHGAILDGLGRLTEKQQQIAARQRARRERLEWLSQTTARGRSAAPARPAGRLFADLAEAGVGLALGYLLEGTGMLDDPAQPAVADSVYQSLEAKQIQRQVHDLILGLCEQERAVIRHFYLEELGFHRVAVLLGVSKGRVSQIHRRALMSLRGALERAHPLQCTR